MSAAAAAAAKTQMNEELLKVEPLIASVLQRVATLPGEKSSDPAKRSVEDLAYSWQPKERIFAFLYSQLKNDLLPVQRIRSDEAMQDRAAADGLLTSGITAGYTYMSFMLTTMYDLVSNGRDDPTWLLTAPSFDTKMIRNRLFQSTLLKEELDDDIVLYNMRWTTDSNDRLKAALTVTLGDETKRKAVVSTFNTFKNLSSSNVRTVDNIAQANHTPVALRAPLAVSNKAVLNAQQKVLSKTTAAPTNAQRAADKLHILAATAASDAAEKAWAAYEKYCGAVNDLMGWRTKYRPMMYSLDIKARLTSEQQALRDKRRMLLRLVEPGTFEDFAGVVTGRMEEFRRQYVTVTQQRLCMPEAELEFLIYAGKKVDLAARRGEFPGIFRDMFGGGRSGGGLTGAGVLNIKNINMTRTFTGSAQKQSAPMSYRALVTINPRGGSDTMEDLDRNVLDFEAQLSARAKRFAPEGQGWKFLARIEQSAPNDSMIEVRYIGRNDKDYDENMEALKRRVCQTKSYQHLPGYALRITPDTQSASQGEHMTVLLHQQQEALDAEMRRAEQAFLAAMRPSATNGSMRSPEELSQFAARHGEIMRSIEERKKLLQEQLVTKVSANDSTVVVVGPSNENKFVAQQEVKKEVAARTGTNGRPSSSSSRHTMFF